MILVMYSALLPILGCLLAANGFRGANPVVVRRGLAGGLLAGSIRGTVPSPTATSTLATASDVSSADTADAAGECASAAASTPLSREPLPGDIVTFTLLRFESDDGLEPPFDTDGTRRLRLDGGNYLPGLHALLSTMSPGETVKGATLDAGYGSYSPNAVVEISTDDVGGIDRSAVKIGTKLQMGNGVTVRVTSMTDDKWTLDANHELAGTSYTADVRLDSVEDGPCQELTYSPGGTDGRYKVATFALGCFWGGELAYQRHPGVVSTQVGYTQGNTEDPTYEEVSSGSTGHTEAVQVVYDPDEVTYGELVELGLGRLGQDVYELNKVGNDRGTQYRSGVYYHDDGQRGEAERSLERLREDGGGREVMTEVKEATAFYPAEEYHQQYLLKGGQSARKGETEGIRCYG